MHNLPRVLPLAVLLASAAGAQDTFLARWEALRGTQLADVELRITAPKLKFYLGETIPLSLAFTAAAPRSFVADTRLQDRVGRLNHSEEFVADPEAAIEDPLRGLPGESGGMGGISGGNAILSTEKAFVVERNLNEWVRFRARGTYRIYVRSRRVGQVTRSGLSEDELRGFAASSAVETISNVLTLEIATAPPAWIADQIAAATAVLDSAPGNDGESARTRQQAGLTLRFLGTLAAGTALARRLPQENSVPAFTLHSGMLDSPHRAELLAVMERLLVAPGQGVTERFLTTMAQLAVLVELKSVMAPYPNDPRGESPAQQSWVAESRRRAALFTEKRAYYISILARSLAAKSPEARAITGDTLIGIAEAGGDNPTWRASVADSLILDFRTLSPRMQSNLLESRWSLLRERAVLPLLNELYENAPPGNPALQELVLRRIHELSPARGRELILKELRRRDGPLRGGAMLLMLPDENLPELNEIFKAQLARGGPPPALLITRYATGEIVKEVATGYLAFHAELDRQKLRHCPFPLVFYFLKFDPEFGEQELRKALTTVPCYSLSDAFLHVGSYAMSPALERLATEYLTSGLVPVKKGAAELLGKYGSTAARQPLWATMEYFRNWWKDREDDLRKPIGWESVLFERTLRSALAQAGGWVMDEPELRRLLALCSTAECRAGVTEWIRDADVPKAVEVFAYSADVRIKIAQYMLTNEREVAAKLAQYPAGTAFRLGSTRSGEAAAIRARIEAAIRSAGHQVVP